MPEIPRPQPGQWIRFRPDTFTMLLAALSALGVALVMAREITYGVALDYDAIQYIAGARNLLAGEGYSDIWGYPIEAWPPLYSLLLATASLGAWDPPDVAGPVNAAVFGLTIFTVGRYLRQRLVSRFLVVWACLAVTLSVPLADQASWALSESLFILLATLALVRIDQFLTDGKPSSLVWAAVFSALAWLTRNMGVVLPVLVGLLLLFQPGTPLIRRARRIAVFSLIAALPIALWVVQNHLLAGYGFDRYALTDALGIDYTVSILLRQALDRLHVHWLYLDQDMALWPSFEFLPAASALLLVVALLLASVGWIFARISHERHITLLTGAHYVFGGFAVVYFVLLITALMLEYTHSGVHARYLAPLYIPLLVVAVVALDRLLVPVHDRRREGMAGGGEGSPPVAASGVRGRVEIQRPLSAVLKMVLSLWALGQVVPSVDQIIRANSGDLYLGYSGPRWASSETLRWIRENPIDAVVYSTDPLAVYLHNGRTSWELPGSCPDVPHDDLYYCLSGTGQEQLRRWLADVPDGTYVIWFYYWYNSRRFDYSAADMRGSSDFEPVAEMADGAIFKIDRNYTPRPGSPLSVYESIVSGGFGEPVLRSTFDIHLEGTTLTYLKDPCVAEDVAAKFFLHVVPRNEADLSAVSRRYQSNFNNLDFTFSQKGAIWDGKCLGVVTLPDYEIARISTGQFIRDPGGSKRPWEVQIPVTE